MFLLLALGCAPETGSEPSTATKAELAYYVWDYECTGDIAEGTIAVISDPFAPPADVDPMFATHLQHSDQGDIWTAEPVYWQNGVDSAAEYATRGCTWNGVDRGRVTIAYLADE
jgi:hypothetical protein